MNNLEKAKYANELSTIIEKHIDNLRELLDNQENFLDGDKSVIALEGLRASYCKIEATEELIEQMISCEKLRLANAQTKLDELLNGEVNRIKNLLNKESEK